MKDKHVSSDLVIQSHMQPGNNTFITHGNEWDHCMFHTIRGLRVFGLLWLQVAPRHDLKRGAVQMIHCTVQEEPLSLENHLPVSQQDRNELSEQMA